MENPSHISPRPGQETRLPKTLESITPQEGENLVSDAIAAQKKFIEWSQKNDHDTSPALSLADKFNKSPSKKIMVTALSTVGLVDVGLTLAADKLGMSPFDTFFIWYASFGAPVLEELVFRSRKIPNVLSMVGDSLGVPIRQDKARLATNVLFSSGHLNPFESAGTNMIALLNTFGIAGALNKVSNERGMTASVALHSVWNATVGATQYLIEGTPMYKKFMIGKEPMMKRLIGNDRHYGIVKNIYAMTQIAAMIGMGIVGINEMMEDRKLHDLLDKIRRAPNGKDLIDIQQVSGIAKTLLATPSTDGYKFQAGVELGYTSSILSMPDEVRDVMSPDQYARSQVHKAVMDVWKDQKTLPYRLEKANTYITQQIAARSQSGIRS